MESPTITDALRAWSGLLGSWRIRDIGYTQHWVWEITSSGGAQFVLKQITDPVRRFVDQARILSHLARCGLPVAVPVPTDDGRIVTRAGDDRYALTPKLPVRQQHRKGVAGDAARAFNIGATMAQMHVALAACPYAIESKQIRPPGLNPETWRLLESGLTASVFADLGERIRPWLPAIDAALSGPAQRVHGDMHGGNILINDDHTVSGIVDVDKLPVAPRIYDLAYRQMFSIEWAYQHDEPAAVIKHSTTLKARHLISGYQSVSPLSEREIHVLPAMAFYTAIGLTCYFLRTTDAVRDTWINTARWITDHPETLLPKEIEA